MGYNTVKKRRFIKEMATAKTPTEAARRAGYAPGAAAANAASRLMHDEEIAKRINKLVDTGLDTLEDVAINGNVEIARVTAAKVLVETGLGKPKDNKQSNIGDITINIAKIDPAALTKLTLPS